MKRLIRFIARLYPAAWRERYGAEFGALLEDISPGFRTPFDVLKGALQMQLHAFAAGKMIVALAAAGTLVAVGIGRAIPNVYESTAVLTMEGSLKMQDTRNAVEALADQAASPASLTELITRYGLYEGVRPRDVVATIKKHITVQLIAAPRPSFTIDFKYTDPAKAQRVTQALASRFVEAGFQTASGAGRPGGAAAIRLLDIAQLPERPVGPNRLMYALEGLSAGLAPGSAAALALYLTRRRASRRTA